MKSFLYVLNIISLYVLLIIIPEGSAQQDERTLSLVFALDTSGSMSERVVGDFGGELRDIDASHMELFYDGILVERDGTDATDPNGLRFSALETLVSWLAAYSQQNDDINIDVTIIEYDNDTRPLLDTTTLGAVQAEGISLTGTTGPGRDADYINLYTELADITDNSDANRQAVFIVTDSNPCNPDGDTNYNGVSVRDVNCDNSIRRAAHLNQAPRLASNVQEHVFFVTPDNLSLTDFWSVYDNSLQAWYDRVDRDYFNQLDTIEEATTALFDAVMYEIAIFAGAIKDDQGPNTALTSQNYADLGILYSTNGSYDLPPFQTGADVLLNVGDRESEVTFEHESNDGRQPEFMSERTAVIQRAKFDSPLTGDWHYMSSVGSVETAWILLESGRARVRVEPSTPSQYVPMRFYYEIVDANNNPMPLSEDLRPGFDAFSLNISDLETPITLAMRINDDQNAFVSQDILPLTASSNISDYVVTDTITTGDSSVWVDGVNYDFLLPDTPAITVSPITFDFTYTLEELGIMSSGPLDFPSSLELTIVGTAEVASREIVFPDGINAQLNFIPPTGDNTQDACPAEAPQEFIFDDTRMQLSTDLVFPTGGRCTLQVSMTLDSDLPPLTNQGTLAINENEPSRDVQVEDTTKLSVVLLDVEGNILNTERGLAMANRALIPPWGVSLIEFFIELHSDGAIVEPIFLDCVEGLEDTSIQEQVACSNDFIPLTLSILNQSSDNVADDYNISIQNTSQAGRYSVRLTGLPAGNLLQLPPAPTTYDIIVDRNEDVRLDFSTFGWEQTRAETTVRVAWTWVLYLVLGVILVALLLSWRIWQQRRTKLRGKVEIYLIEAERLASGEGSLSVMPLWKEAWASRSDQKFRKSAFSRPMDLAILDIKSLYGTTNGETDVSKNGEAIVTIDTSRGVLLADKKLEPNKPEPIKSDDNRKYYVVVSNTSDTLTLADFRNIETQP